MLSWSPLAQPQDVFNLMSAPDLDALIALAHPRTYAKGEFIFRAGDASQYVYFLRDGRAKIFQVAPSGKEVILWFCFPGEVCGLSEVARGGERSVSAIACDKTTVLNVANEAFQAYLLGHPHAAFSMIQMLSCRLRGLSDMTLNLVSDDVQTRAAKLILRLSSRYGRRVGTEILLDIPLTHQEMADMIGTTRQSFTSVLNEFKRQGILSIDNRRIQIQSEKSFSQLNHLAASENLAIPHKKLEHPRKLPMQRRASKV